MNNKSKDTLSIKTAFMFLFGFISGNTSFFTMPQEDKPDLAGTGGIKQKSKHNKKNNMQTNRHLTRRTLNGRHK